MKVKSLHIQRKQGCLEKERVNKEYLTTRIAKPINSDLSQMDKFINRIIPYTHFYTPLNTSNYNSLTGA